MVSSQTQESMAVRLSRSGEPRTIKMITTAPRMQPRNMPKMKRLGRLPRLGVKPHCLAKKYWLVTTKDIMSPLAANVMSLNWTVGVSPL